MTISAKDAEGYLYPGPDHEIGLQVGFVPSPQLDTALRGFLLPERTIGDGEEWERKSRSIGGIVLRSTVEKRFGFERSDNEGIRFKDYAKELGDERIRFDKIQHELIMVGDISLGISDQSDLLVTLLLQPTGLQRRALGGLVLSSVLGAEDGQLMVYKHFHHNKVEAERKDVVRRAHILKKRIHAYKSQIDGRPLANWSSPLFVRQPQLMHSELSPPKPRSVG
jgi:hypothetical protein